MCFNCENIKNCLDQLRINAPSSFYKTIKYQVDNTEKKTKNYMHIGILYNTRTHDILTWSTSEILKKSFKEDNPTRCTIHAEQMTYRKFRNSSLSKPICKSNLRGKIGLISIRVSRTGKMGNSLACTSCAELIFRKNISDIFVYIDNKGECQKIPTKDILKIPNIRYSSCQHSYKNKSR